MGKPRIWWCIKAPPGIAPGLRERTCRHLRHVCITDFSGGSSHAWRVFLKRGYRAAKIRVEEVDA